MSKNMNWMFSQEFMDLCGEIAADPAIHGEMTKLVQSGGVSSVAELRDAIYAARVKAVVGPVMDR